ncbi:FtsK/SpoIIIE domain-containing protein [Streptomyces sp. ME02-6979.5a]|uniref:FtsK/SpoIIIE domain-containing protein n=1 Tax=unclassified Streptomyces TaxID=2593676 RepID=UPI0029BF4DCD|nr:MULTISPECIES: FtsK/SpoIIIE domain-containing protein [unclassified Streptomyces]MDX3343719.1 FtsK/SpoIIIE domain-containing protein [Streptomyces sp. ME02-6979.5a]MDX5526187.1 FtsK/SpoIIIE domain-containing protein [Streptomyces sp. DE06-01C]
MSDILSKPDTTVIDATGRFPHPVTGDIYDQEKDTTPVAEVAVEKNALPDDEIPLIPSWTRTPAGWKARTGIARVNQVRSFRRWVRRQSTEHGHTAQTFRGLRRTFAWVQGTEGVQVATARQEVQQAHKAYKTAKWGHDKRLVPGKEKDKRRKEMEVAFAASNTAMTRYRSERRAARVMRTLRGAAATAPAAVVETAGAHFLGWGGTAIATGSVLAALALIGRRTTGGDLYNDHDVKFGDTLKLTDSMLNKIYRDAKVIGADEVVELLTPCTLTADGKAWEVTLDLPSGTPLKKALAAKTGVASALGVKVQQLHQAQGDREGRLQLRVSLHLPFTGKPTPGPLLAMDCVSLWQAIPMGVNLRGQEVSTSWVERSGLFGGEPGAGKSAAANDLLLAAALDPTVALYLCDGKAGADITPFEGIAAMYDTDGEPERLLEILQHIWNVEIPRRRALAKEHGSRKLTAAMAAKDPRVNLAVLLVDEWSSYGAAADRATREEMERLLRLIVQQGRALGIVTLCATQKPDADSVPSGIRDILSIRWAMRCLTPQASDTILGQGYAAAGHNAQDILKSQRGVGIYMDGEGAEPELTRGYYYDDDEVALLLERAHALRAKAGTLPAGPATLADRLRALDDDHASVMAVLLDTFDAHAGDDGEPAEWLPGTVLVDALSAAGLNVSADSLGRMVIRTDEEKGKRTWQSGRAVGYPRSRVLITVRDWHKLDI